MAVGDYRMQCAHALRLLNLYRSSLLDCQEALLMSPVWLRCRGMLLLVFRSVYRSPFILFTSSFDVVLRVLLLLGVVTVSWVHWQAQHL